MALRAPWRRAGRGAVPEGAAPCRAGRWRRSAGCRAVLYGFEWFLCGAERCCRCYAEPWGPPLRGGGRDGAAWVPAAPTACGTPVSECRRPPSWGARAPLTPSPEESWAQPRTLRCPCPVPCPSPCRPCPPAAPLRAPRAGGQRPFSPPGRPRQPPLGSSGFRLALSSLPALKHQEMAVMVTRGGCGALGGYFGPPPLPYLRAVTLCRPIKFATC